MTSFWKSIIFVSLWSAFWIGIFGFFAARALITGKVFGGGEMSGEQWIYRAQNPVRFRRTVLFYYAMALLGVVPWILILLVGIKE